MNLEEVSAFDEDKLLPEKEMLYFFFNLDSTDDGKVIFSKEVTGLKKAIAPIGFKGQKQSFWKRFFVGKSQKKTLAESNVDIYKDFTFPSWDSLRIERIQKIIETEIKPIDAFEESIYEESYEEGETEITSNHHLLGNYHGIQNEFHELNFLSSSMNDFEDLTVEVIDEALRWKLLFQFDSDKNLEVIWGGGLGKNLFCHS